MVQLKRFVAGRPEAVFITRTDAKSLDDVEGLRRAGYTVARYIFEQGGGAVEKYLVKPNVTIGFPRERTGELVRDSGVATNAWFVGGVVDALVELGAAARDVKVVEGGGGDMAQSFKERGYVEMAAQRRVELISLTKQKYGVEDLNWVRVDGVVHREVPLVRPIGDPGTRFINVPAMKTHNLSITSLCTKNLQGTIAVGYRHFCHRLEHMEKYPPEVLAHFQPGFREAVLQGFKRHLAEGYPEWDEIGEGDELYCQRACDALLASKPWVNIVEGVIGRDGSGFRHGRDVLANLGVAGINPVHVDAVTTYLMGHNPGNVGYLKVARERGLGKSLEDMDVYLLTDEGPVECEDLSKVGRLSLGVYHHGDPSRHQFF